MFRTDMLRPMTVACALTLVLSTALSALAQSGSRSYGGQPPATRSAPPSGSDNKAPVSAGSASRGGQHEVAMRGYCPVCLVEMKQWVRGEPNMAVDYDGKRYLFPGQEQMAMFQQNPAKYAPALGGNDIVHFAHTGQRVAGKLGQGVLHEGRAFLFASDDNKQMFRSNPDSFAHADLALGGECVVCRVEMNQRVAGAPEHTVLYQGMRYQFPGEEQKSMFVASPARYANTVSGGPPAAGSGTRQPASGSGSRPQPSGSGTR